MSNFEFWYQNFESSRVQVLTSNLKKLNSEVLRKFRVFLSFLCSSEPSLITNVCSSTQKHMKILIKTWKKLKNGWDIWTFQLKPLYTNTDLTQLKKLRNSWAFTNFWASIQTWLTIIFEFWVLLLNSNSIEIDLNQNVLHCLISIYNADATEKVSSKVNYQQEEFKNMVYVKAVTKSNRHTSKVCVCVCQ